MKDFGGRVSGRQLPLLALMLATAHALLGDEVAVSLTPFQLSYTPGHVARHLTREVTLRCDHDKRGDSQLAEISRIRLVKKSSSGWDVLAEMKDTEDRPTSVSGVRVAGNIGHDLDDIYLEVTWPVAVDQTFGTYRCDVIGFDQKFFQLASEVTSEIALREEKLTTDDLMLVLRQTMEDVSSIQEDTRSLVSNLTAHSGELAALGGDVQSQADRLSSIREDVRSLNATLIGEVSFPGERCPSLDNKVNSINETVTSLTSEVSSFERQFSAIQGQIDAVDGRLTSTTDEMRFIQEQFSSLGDKFSNLSVEVASLGSKLDALSHVVSQPKTPFTPGDMAAWPMGQYALLEPRSGCPADLTFVGGTGDYMQIHTESTRGVLNGDSHSAALPDWTKSFDGVNNFIRLQFCEASGDFAGPPWPKGSYCVLKIAGEDGFPCPTEFSDPDGYLFFDYEDTDPIYDHTSEVVYGGYELHFCCMDSPDPVVPMVLPTRSPFLLFRRGAQCQAVQGMTVTEESLDVDTEDANNNDHFNFQETDHHDGVLGPLRIHLCYYTKL